MPGKQPVCVVDASVLIDLIGGGIIVEFQSLPMIIVIPDIIEDEVDRENNELLNELEFLRMEFSAEQVLEVSLLKSSNKNISTPDLFAYLGAKIKYATLLTGDKELRVLAEQEGLNVHGIIWIIDELKRLNILIPKRASLVLREIKRKGSYLPKEEYIKRFRSWGESEEFWSRLF